MYGLPKNACDPSLHLSVPSIGYVSVCRKLSPRLRVGSQVFALLMFFLCVMLHAMWSDTSIQLLCIFRFCYVVLVCLQCDI